MSIRSSRRLLVALGALFVAGGVAGVVNAMSAPEASPMEVPVGGKVATENACYVRLPDMPEPRYGGFGAYNEQTGVLAFAGGAVKQSSENTEAHFEMYAIKLDGDDAKWKTVNYSDNVGYTRDFDKGCREMATVRLSDTNWVSVMGKDGCDNGAFDTSKKKGGDFKELSVGDTTSSVRWVPNSGLSRLVGELVAAKGKLARSFAVYDTERDRVVFGQGTFDDERDQLTQDEIYEANKVGSKWQMRELRPTGPVPYHRFSTCGAYVYDKDTGVDGVLVLGGQQGGQVDTTSFKEVWWLDFSGGADGEWNEVTSRFANMDALGYRRGGACAYDADSKYFYSWMGRADKSVPDGAKRSAGAWRVNLADLADQAKPLTWERLGKDDLTAEGINGRRLIPSVFDFANKRMFAIGGRNGLDEYKDVWAIYPDVTGAACQNLDPYEPYRPSVPPTATTGPTRVPPTPGPGPTGQPWQPPAPNPQPCDQITNRVPNAVIAQALASKGTDPSNFLLCNPGLPISPYNHYRDRLSLQDFGKNYHPVFNPVQWQCGCP